MSERKNSSFKRKVLNYVANIVCYNHSGGENKVFIFVSMFFVLFWVSYF